MKSHETREWSLYMDIRLHFIDKGSGEPLVLLHGNGESSEYFSRQIGFFSDRCRVLAVDTRGHGLSPRGTGPFTLERFSDDLYGFLTGLNIERADLLGFSDGGNIALTFALKYPGKVGRLILNGANLNPFGLKWNVLLPICLDWLAAAARARFDRRAAGRKELLSLMATQPRIKASALRRISAPALVIAGSRDMIRTAHTKKIYRHLKRARLVIVPGTHFIARENSEAFNEAVRRFISEEYTM
jgi:pimeloyl-ACP methyl ester carboxylesterase